MSARDVLKCSNCENPAVKSITFAYKPGTVFKPTESPKTKYTLNFCKQCVTSELKDRSRHGSILKIQKVKNE